jgi:predicted TIM-barrel fold metal-dependent hydrolase
MLIIGILFTPSFVAKHVKHAVELETSQVMKVLSYQLYAITIGCMMIALSIPLFKIRYYIIIFVLIFVAYAFVVHNVYINKLYPENVILNSTGLKKVARVLLGKDYVISDYQPKSMLMVKNRQVLKAKYPAIDIHFHLASLITMSAEELVKAMDRCGVDKIVNLDGNPEIFEKYNKEFKEKYPSRFVMFAVLNWQEVAKPDFIKNQLELLTNMVKNGAKGLKVYKSFGLKIRDQSGNIVHIDDSRLDPIWERAGELKLPVLIHLSDPTPFFTPIDRYNERLEELQEFPQWSFFGPEFPKKETLLERGENLLKKHPRTNFILAHMADIPENLSHLGTLLNKYPNLYLDMSSRVPELGRQPYTAREFFIRYQDRVLFGTDGGYALDENGLWPAERYFRTNFEFLETTNEYFEYPLWGINKQGRWRVYGIGLPDKVLEKIYYKNAKNLLKIND